MNRPIEFWKVEAVGNDFVLVHESVGGEGDWAGLARAACKRRIGIGADGLLVVSPNDEGLAMRMFNPDGTEDFCGNGMRCAAAHGFEQGWVGREFVILHGGRTVPTEVSPSGIVTTRIPPASFEPAEVPLIGEPLIDATLDVAGYRYRATALTTGSTHTILACETLPDDVEVRAVGPALEHDPRFPDRTSIIWSVVSGEATLQIRIWERGAGETLGCGTGSSAAAVVWGRLEGRRGPVTVHNPGGDVVVDFDRWEGPLALSSGAKTTYRGTWLPGPGR
ncbi:MAG TPA: diaminopimelate epimerase [Fimbriimonadaceae bacterium]|nr:diaminopimelate epimerase [Fimbriimonadaceae bacterium]